MSAWAAVTPITRPNGTMPVSQGTIARAPAARWRRAGSEARSTGRSTGRRGSVVAVMGISSGGSVVGSGPVAGGGPGHRIECRSGGVDLDRDGDAVGDDVEHRRAGPGLLDEGLQLLGGGVALHVEGDPDRLEAVAHVGVEAEDAVEVDVALDGRGDLGQLDAARGGDVPEP